MLEKRIFIERGAGDVSWAAVEATGSVEAAGMEVLLVFLRQRPRHGFGGADAGGEERR